MSRKRNRSRRARQDNPMPLPPLVYDLPDSPVLTEEDIARIRAESHEWRTAFERKTRWMVVPV